MNSAPTPSANHSVHLCAELPAEWKEELEELLFFNPQQAALENEILASIRAFGIPRIRVEEDRLRIEVGNGLVVGTLFALADTEDGTCLAGALLFLRKDTGLLCLHLSVDESYSFRGPHASLGVAAHMLDGLREIGARIVGIDHVEIYRRRMGWQKIQLTTRLK